MANEFNRGFKKRKALLDDNEENDSTPSDVSGSSEFNRGSQLRQVYGDSKTPSQQAEAELDYKQSREESGLKQDTKKDAKKDDKSIWDKAKQFAGRVLQGTVTKGREKERESKATTREQELSQFLAEAEKVKKDLDPSKRQSILNRMPEEFRGEDSEWINFYLTWEVIKKDAQEQLATIQQNKKMTGYQASGDFKTYGALDVKEIVSEGGLKTQFADGTATNASEAMDLIRTHNENLRKYKEENIEGYDIAKYDTEYWQKQEREWKDLLDNANEITTGKPIQKDFFSGFLDSMDEVREQAFMNSLSKYVGESAAKKLQSGEANYEDLSPSERVEIGQMLLDQARGQIDTTTEVKVGDEKIPIDWYSVGQGLGGSAVYMQEIAVGSLLTGGVMNTLGAAKLLAPISKADTGGKALYYAKRIGQSLIKGVGIEASTGFIKDFATTADDMNGEYMFVFDEEEGVSIDTIMEGEDNPYRTFAENVATQSVMNALEIIGVDTLGTAKGATSAVVKKAIGEEAFEELTKTIGKSTLYSFAKKFGASNTGEILNGIRELAGLGNWGTEIEEELWQGWWEGLTDNEDWIPTGKEFAEIVGVTGIMQLTFNAMGLGGKVIGKDDQDKMNKVLTEMVEQGVVTEDAEVEIMDTEQPPVEDGVPTEQEEELTQAEINKRMIQADLEARGEVEQEVDRPLTEIVQQSNRQEAYDAVGDQGLADKIIDGKIESATQLMAEAEKAGVTQQLAESLGVYDLIDNPEAYIEKIGMNPEQLTESAAVNEAFRVLSVEMMSEVAKQAKTKEATKQEQLQGDISLDQLSSEDLSRLGGIVNSIQATFDNPPSRTSTQVESGEWVVSKDGVAYPSFVSEGLRNKKILSIAMDAINNDTVPKGGTKAYDAYQEIINHAVGTTDTDLGEETLKKAQPKAKKKAKLSEAVGSEKKKKKTSDTSKELDNVAKMVDGRIVYPDSRTDWGSTKPFEGLSVDDVITDYINGHGYPSLVGLEDYLESNPRLLVDTMENILARATAFEEIVEGEREREERNKEKGKKGKKKISKAVVESAKTVGDLPGGIVQSDVDRFNKNGTVIYTAKGSGTVKDFENIKAEIKNGRIYLSFVNTYSRKKVNKADISIEEWAEVAEPNPRLSANIEYNKTEYFDKQNILGAREMTEESLDWQDDEVGKLVIGTPFYERVKDRYIKAIDGVYEKYKALSSMNTSKELPKAEETDQEAIERIVGDIFSVDNTLRDNKDPLYEYNTLTNTYTDDFKGRAEVLEAINDVAGGVENIERVEAGIDLLTPTEIFDYNNEGVQRAIKEISSGVITPLVVDSNLEIYDGNHRFVAYKTLGIKRIPILKPKDSQLENSLMLNDVEPSPYRDSYPRVRGGWTVAKIDRVLRDTGSASGEKAWTREWNKFDNDAQLEQNLFYHGTQNYISGGIKPSSALKNMGEEELGGGYGERYHSISLTKSRNTAKNFSGATSRTVNIYPVLLKKGAVVADLSNEVDDSIDLEDRLEELWNKGVDAVWIGGGEQELAVLNPRAIVLGSHIKESFPVYGLSKLENKALEELASETAEVVKNRLKQLETSVGMLMKRPDDLHDFDPKGLKRGILNLIEAERLRERHKLPPKKHTACVDVFLELARKEFPIPTPVRAVWAKDVNHATKVLNRFKSPTDSILAGFHHIDTAQNIVELNKGNPKSVYIGDPRYKKYMKEGYKLFTEEQIVGEKYLSDSAVEAKTTARKNLLRTAAMESANKVLAQKYADMENPNNKLFARVITQDVGIKRVGRYSIEGKTINNNQDIVTNLDAYRGHHYEIFHLVFVDDTGKVVSHRAYSDLQRTAVSLPITNEPRMDRLVQEVKASGATKFYMVHNHPSQDTKPSDADYHSTIGTINEFKSRGLEYVDHIILDTNKVSYLGKPSTAMPVFDDFWIGSRYQVRELDIPLVHNAKQRSSIFQTPKNKIDSVESFGSLVKEIKDKKIPLNGFNLFPVKTNLGYKSPKDIIPLIPATGKIDKNLNSLTDIFGQAVINYNKQIGAIYDNLKSFRGFLIISEADLTPFERNFLRHHGQYPFYATDVAFIEEDGTIRVLGESSLGILPSRYTSYIKTFDYSGEGSRYFDDENLGNRLFDSDPLEYNRTPDTLEDLDKKIQPIALPELLQMAQGLLENDIELKSLRKNRGFFQRIGDQGRLVLKREMFSPEKVMIIEGGKIKEGFKPESPEEIKQRLRDISSIMAHEMGHMVDWLDNKEMARGNILGRIASLRGYMKGKYGNLENKEIRAELINHSDNWRLDKNVISQLQESQKKAKEVVQLAKDKGDSDAQKRAEKYLKQINKELKYYTSSVELYADALSALLVDPDTLRKNAPKFYNGFMDYVHRKPKVREALFDAYDLISEGQQAINRARFDNLVKAIDEGRKKREEIDVKKIEAPGRSFKKAFDKIISLTVSQYNPIYSAIDASMADKGVKMSKKAEVRLKLEDLAMINNDLGLYVEKVENIFAEMVKAGISEDQASVLAILERTLGDRKDIANPNAMMYQYSEETLEELKGQLTPEQYDVLMEQMKKFRELNFDLVQKGAEAGLYSGDFMRDIAEKNKDTYMPFGVLDYIESNYVTSRVIQMVGTLKEVESPIATQILKSIAIIQATAENNAKREVVSALLEVDPDNVKPAQVIRGKNGRFIKFKKVSDPEVYDVIPLMVDGKYTGFEVDKQIAAMFTEDLWRTEGGQSAMQLAKVAGFFNFYFKPLVTSYNLSWALYANPIRDFQRSSKGLFAVLSAEGKLSAVDKLSLGISLDLRLLKNMATSLKPAFKYARGQTTDITSEMIEKKLIDYQADPITTEDLDKYESFALLAPALRRIGKLAPEVEYKASKANRVRESIRNSKTFKTLWFLPDLVLKGVSGLGRVFEVWSKISGYRILKEAGVSETTLINSTRNYIGTPNFKEKGIATPFTNKVWVFSNVALQAQRTQLELMKNPKTRGAFWLKLLSTAVIPKFIQLLVEYGWLGDDDDELAMKMATFYDRAKYLVFPIGLVTNPETGDREAVYMRIPQDEGTRTFGTIAYQIMKMAMDEDEQWDAKNFGKTAKFTMDDINPYSTSIGMDLVSMWSSYLQDRNPYDDYRGRNAINQQLWDAGGRARFMEMVKLTGNSVGLTSFKTYDEPSNTTLEYVLDLPVLERMFRMTSYGLTEEWYAKQDEKAMGRSREKLEEKAMLSDLVDNYLNNDKLEMNEAIAEYQISVMGKEPDEGWKGVDKAKNTRLRKDFKEAVFEYHEPNAHSELTVYGMRNTDKIEVYNGIKSRRSSTDWAKFATMARDLEVMSDDMLELLIDEGVIDEKLGYKLEKL